MGLRMPNWDQAEYACLTPDLAGVTAYTKYLEAMGTADQIRDQIKEVTSLPPSGLDLLDEIQATILRIQGRVLHPKEARPRVLEGLKAEFLEACKQPNLPADVRVDKKEYIARQIMNLYFAFPVKEFETDYHEVFHDECTNNVSQKRLDKLRKALEKAKADVEATDWRKGDAGAWFKAIPNRFRDRRVHPGFKREAMARHIVESFVADWRHRAVKFAVPVSITGVEIATMPRQMGDIWLRAYKGLGLDKAAKSAVFIPKQCDVQAEKVAPPKNANIPATFQPKGA